MSLAKLKSLGKESVIYGISGIVTRMITVFLVPVYTRIFEPSDYGVISLVNTTFFLASILSICALDNAAARWYFDTNESDDRKKTFASWFWFQFFLSVTFAVFLFIAIPVFSRYVIEMPVRELWLIWLLPCCTLITNILPNMIWNWFRLNRKPKATLYFTISQSIFTIVLTILFVIYLDWHIMGVYAALFISSLLFSVVALTFIKGWISISYFNRDRIREMLRFSAPMVPAAIAFWLLNSTAAYFIQFFSSKAEVGLFSVGATVATAVSLLTGAFQQAWGPFAYSIINEPDSKKVYADVFLLFGVVSSIVLLVMFLFSPEILVVFTTPDYYGAAWVTSILSINIILIAFTYIAAIGTSIKKNSTYYSKGVLMAAIVTVVLNIILIPKWGKEGSALAMVLGQIIVPVYLFYHANRLYPINYNFVKVLVYLVVALGLGIICRLFPFKDESISLGSKFVVLFLFGLFVYISMRQHINLYLIKKDLNKASL